MELGLLPVLLEYVTRAYPSMYKTERTYRFSLFEHYGAKKESK